MGEGDLNEARQAAEDLDPMERLAEVERKVSNLVAWAEQVHGGPIV